MSALVLKEKLCFKNSEETQILYKLSRSAFVIVKMHTGMKYTLDLREKAWMLANAYLVSTGQWHYPPKSYLQPVWPDWAIYWILGNFLKPLATINLPKSPTFLVNYCKCVKMHHFSSEIK